MAARIELTLWPKADVKPLDIGTAQRIARVARAEAVDLDRDSAVFGFSPSETDRGIARGTIELAARFELGAHWHTRYELVDR